MKLYDAGLSPNCLRVRAVAFELGFELDIVPIDLFGGAASKEEFLAINPNGKIPVLADGDFVLWESRAINRYLASLRPERNLHPADAKARARVDQWCFWQAIHLGPAMQKVTFERLFKTRFGMGEPDETIIETQMKEVGRYLGVLEQLLEGREWVVDDLSLADFAIATTFPFRDAAAMSLADCPRVAAWIERVEQRDSWKRATAPLRDMR